METSAQPTAKTSLIPDRSNFLTGQVFLFLALWSACVAENKRLQARIAELEAALQLERAKRFGRSSERNAKSSPKVEGNSAPLIIEGEAQEVPVVSSTPRQRGGQPGHKGHGRNNLPPNLPREEVECALAEDERGCDQCGLPYTESTLTEDAEEVVIEVKAHVRRYRRKRYRPTCQCPGSKFITAPIPPKLIPKGKFSVESWVKFLLDKYQFQIPIARQACSERSRTYQAAGSNWRTGG